MRSMKILSGGQTGVDRAALDAAIELDIAYGGWCPKDGWAEDLSHPPGLLALYGELSETPLSDPLQRTEWNVRDADRLLILVRGAGLAAFKGTVAARDFAVRLGRPHLVIDLDAADAPASALAFLGAGEDGAVLCIAGPRESEAPGIYAQARHFLRSVFASVDRRILNRM